RGQHHHLCVPAGHHGVCAGLCLLPGRSPGQSRRRRGSIGMTWLQTNLKLLASYPSAVTGMVIILLLVALSIYAMATMPLAQAITLWRAGEGICKYTPRNAVPAWLNWFRRE